MLKQYEKYKDSGVVYLGSIPDSWEISKYKFTNEILMGQSPSSEDYSFEENSFPFLQGNAEFGKFYPEAKIWCEKATKYSQPNDILISVRAPVGAINISDKKYGIGRGLAALRGRDNLPQFIYYFFSVLSEYLNSESSGSTFTAISTSDIKEIILPKISLQEQTQIALYLDYQTHIIDQLISQKQKLIDLLKEKRQAIINEAVTKGLNPNAKMKDSGIEWLGEVPEHWRTLNFRYVIDILTDFTANGSFADLAKNVTYLESGYSRLIRLTDLREDLKNNGIYVSEETHKYLSKSSLYGGEVLLANVGAYSGLAWKVPIINDIATLGPNMFLLKFENNLDNDFAYFSLISDYLSSQLKNKAISSAQPKLNKEDVRSCLFILPPLDEQQEIVERLIKINEDYDNLISNINSQIEKLKEYRQSIISEAVTGKIDVRDWKVSES